MEGVRHCASLCRQETPRGELGPVGAERPSPGNRALAVWKPGRVLTVVDPEDVVVGEQLVGQHLPIAIRIATPEVMRRQSPTPLFLRLPPPNRPPTQATIPWASTSISNFNLHLNALL